MVESGGGIQCEARAHSTLMSEWRIQDAEPSEAPQIGHLLRTSLKADYLILSVYSSSLGDRHLEQSIQDSRGPRVRVIRSRGTILGCSIVTSREGCHHLDYVAVAPNSAGTGIGSRLLEDALGSASGQLSLDVYRSNRMAYGWYQRKGFVQKRSMPVQVIDLHGVEPRRRLGRHASRHLETALKMESIRGFGEFELISNATEYRFSVLGTRTVKVLDCPEGRLEWAALVMRNLLPEREALALRVGQRCSRLPKLLDDSMVRMVKASD